MSVWRMRIACWINKATNTHSEHVGLIFIAFPLQQWLSERALKSSYTYVACLVNYLLTDCSVVIKTHTVTNFEMTNRRCTKQQRTDRQ